MSKGDYFNNLINIKTPSKIGKSNKIAKIFDTFELFENNQKIKMPHETEFMKMYYNKFNKKILL